MYNVLQIVGGLSRGGTETFIMNLLRNIDRSVIHFDFLIFSDNQGGFCDEVLSLGSKIYRIPISRSHIFNYCRALNMFFKNNAKRYDCVHFHGNSFNSLIPIRYARRYGIQKRIVHSHNTRTFGFHNILIHKWNRRNIHKIATDYLACSTPAKDWGYKESKVYNKAKVIPNGIDIEHYGYNDEARNAIRISYDVGDSLLIGTVGRITAVKNQAFLIDILAKLNKRIDTKLMIVGEGELQNSLIEKAKALGLSDRVIFTGAQSNVAQYYSAMDVFAMPSLYEGLPYVGIEAQANGLTCIFSDTVSDEIALSPNVKFLSLGESAEVWANMILESYKHSRSIDSGWGIHRYSIKNTVEEMQSIYLN